MRVRIEKSSDGGVTLNLDGREIFFRSKDAELNPSGDAALCALLLPAMTTAADLELDTPLSPRLMENSRTLQDIFAQWLPAPTVQVTAPTAAPPTGQGTLSFFSGGLDSLYTLVKNMDRIDTLVYVHGFDIPLDNTALRNSVSAELRRAADGLGKKLIEVETNLRVLQREDPKRLTWGMYHAGAISAIAHLLGYERAYLGSSYRYADLFPWGSHPLTDPLWSGDATTIVHDGCEAARHEKAEAIAKHPIALQTLRVCWKNTGGKYNCGTCEKCVRTMVNLYAVGAIDRAMTFPRGSLTPELVRGVLLKDSGAVRFAKENLQAVEATEDRLGIAPALRYQIRRAPINVAYTKARKGAHNLAKQLRRRLA